VCGGMVVVCVVVCVTWWLAAGGGLLLGRAAVPGLLEADNRPMIAEGERAARRRQRLKQLESERTAEASRQAEKQAVEQVTAEDELASVQGKDVRAGLGNLFSRGG